MLEIGDVGPHLPSCAQHCLSLGGISLELLAGEALKNKAKVLTDGVHHRWQVRSSTLSHRPRVITVYTATVEPGEYLLMAARTSFV